MQYHPRSAAGKHLERLLKHIDIRNMGCERKEARTEGQLQAAGDLLDDLLEAAEGPGADQAQRRKPGRAAGLQGERTWCGDPSDRT